MPASVAEFVQATEDSGILAADVLAEYVQGVVAGSDATALANRLVKDGRLTAFQAKCIYGGKANSLVLGPYVVLDMLGKGGMGYVYKAEHRRMRRVVALKVIAKQTIESSIAVRRFEREVEAAARLEHPNIVTAHDAGEAAGTHYLAMQYVDGRNLSEVVKELGPQPEGRVVDWILQTARGLAYAHRQGVVHRDIKPGNLLIDRDGTVRILDMGLARLVSRAPHPDELTASGQIIGTIDYMAPEQAMDTRRADVRSDIYSLGATLWYLLAGRPMFDGDSAIKKIIAHQQMPAPILREAGVASSLQLDAAFQRMVAKAPVDRFQSMQEVIAALEALPPDERAAGPPSIDFRGGPATLGPLGAAALVHGHPQDVDGDRSLPRAETCDSEMDPASQTKPTVGRRDLTTLPGRRPVVHLAIGTGVLGICVIAGLILFSFHERGGNTASRPGDGATHDAMAQPAAPPLAVAPFDGEQARNHQIAWARHLGVEVETTNSIGATLVLVPPGRFTRGEGGRAVEVTLAEPFLIGRTEVTQGQWREVMGTEPWKGKRYTIEGADVAATYVSWEDAVAFCKNLTARERGSGAIGHQQAYRLPTEVEWEYACRAGSRTAFSFGDDERLLGEHAWFGGGWEPGIRRPIPGGNTVDEPHAHAVMLKRPNPWGLFDMHGNVFEWTETLSSMITAAPDRDSTGNSWRLRCGGSWLVANRSCRSASCDRFALSDRSGDLGFRMAINMVVPFRASASSE